MGAKEDFCKCLVESGGSVRGDGLRPMMGPGTSFFLFQASVVNFDFECLSFGLWGTEKKCPYFNLCVQI